MPIQIKDPELILSCAFRYALGRRTYVVSAVVDDILSNWNEIHSSTKERFKKEIIEHKNLYGDLGMSCDEAEWNIILNKEI